MINKEVVVFQIEDMLSNINKENLLSFGGHIDNGAAFLELMTNVLTLLKEQEAVNKNTGQWKNGHCSCCGEDISSMLDTWTNIQNFLFCPKCGAKMEE